MGQGDITIFDYAAKYMLDGRIKLSGGIAATLINNFKVAKVDDEEPNVSDYSRVSLSYPSGPVDLPQYYLNGITLVESGGDAPMIANPFSYWEALPTAIFLTQPYQALLFQLSGTWNRLGGAVPRGWGLGFVDLTPDDGVTPWDLTTASLIINWGASNVVTQVET